MKRDRPTLYSPELAEAICERVADGRTLEQSARHEGMPCRYTVWQWAKNKDDFSHMLQRAREWMAVSFVNEALEIADGTVGNSLEEIQAAKLRIDCRKWIAILKVVELNGQWQQLWFPDEEPEYALAA